MNKLLIVYNIFGNTKPQNTSYYVDAIDSILDQNIVKDNPDTVQVALSVVTPHAQTIIALKHNYRNRLSINWVHEVLPLSITFNATVRACVAHYGEFEGYLYVDSGISFVGQPDVMGKMYEKMNSSRESHNGRYAMVAIQPTNDTGYDLWGIPRGEGVIGVVIPPSRTVNLHCQVFSNELYTGMAGRILPDIFANDSSESVFSYMCAAVQQQFYVDFSQRVLHLHSLDGASAGSRAGLLFLKPGSTKQDMTPIYDKGKEFGFGFEAIEPNWPHDKTQFDKHHFSTNPGLLPFLMENLFVPEERFSYETINSHFEWRE